MGNDEPVSCGPCLANIVSSQEQSDQIDWSEIGIERPLCVACKEALQEHIHKIVLIESESKSCAE